MTTSEKIVINLTLSEVAYIDYVLWDIYTQFKTMLDSATEAEKKEIEAHMKPASVILKKIQDAQLKQFPWMAKEL